MIKAHTKAQHARSLANYLPSGKLFAGAFTSGTNFRNFIVGMATELQRSEAYLLSYQDEYDIRTTTLFIAEWESALGIPDDCFTNTGTIEERRRNVLAKLASLGVQTRQDFIDLAALFGVNVTILSGSEVGGFPVVFPFILLSAQELRFTMIVQYTIVGAETFPLTFPFIFGDSVTDLMECLFSKLKPANVKLTFQEI